MDQARERFYRRGSWVDPAPSSEAGSSRTSASWPTSGAISRGPGSLPAIALRLRAHRRRPGCAIAYHNLGMVSADREMWDEADEHFRRSLDITAAVGDVHLRGSGC